MFMLILKKSSNNPFDDREVVKNLGPLMPRSSGYKSWLLGELTRRGCRRVLDAGCGTGVDSFILIENGIEVVSCDDAEAMLHHARAERAKRKDEPQMKTWEIVRANWLNLETDLAGYRDFDAVLCLGSSIFHLIDTLPGLPLYRQCLTNFKRMLKPGGVLLIDHRNMDSMLDRGYAVNKNVYHMIDTIESIDTRIIEKDGSPVVVEITYGMRVETQDQTGDGGLACHTQVQRVTMPLCPVRVQIFAALLKEEFGENCNHNLFGDLTAMQAGSEIAYFQHSVEKA